MNRGFPSDYSNIVEGNPHFFDAPPHTASLYLNQRRYPYKYNQADSHNSSRSEKS